MKKIYVPLLFVVFFSDAFSQGLLKPIWCKTRSSLLKGGQADAWSVDVDASGSIYWPINMDSTATDKLYDILIYKYDSLGREKWVSYCGGAGLQHASICNAQDTALYLGGRENTVAPYNGSADHMFIIKISKQTGAILKRNDGINFGDSTGYDEMDAIEPRKDGIYCGGWAQVKGTAGDYEMGFLKLDYNLNILVENYFGDTAHGHAEHQDGHFVVDSNYIFAGGLWDGHSAVNNEGDGRAMLGKFDRTNLTMVDTALYGATLSEAFDLQNTLGSATDGKYIYTTGYAEPSNTSNLQIFVAKFDKNLKLQWINYFGRDGSEEARAIIVHNGYIYVGGSSNSPSFASQGGYDAVLLVYDTAGKYIGYNTFGDTKDNEFRDMAIYGHSIYLTGTTGTNMFGGGTSDSAFLIKADLNEIMTGFKTGSKIGFMSIVYPNPSPNEIIVRLLGVKKMGITIFHVYDASGKEVKEISQSSEGSLVKLNIADLPKGKYLLKTNIDNSTEVVNFERE